MNKELKGLQKRGNRRTPKGMICPSVFYCRNKEPRTCKALVLEAEIIRICKFSYFVLESKE